MDDMTSIQFDGVVQALIDKTQSVRNPFEKGKQETGEKRKWKHGNGLHYISRPVDPVHHTWIIIITLFPRRGAGPPST